MSTATYNREPGLHLRGYFTLRPVRSVVVDDAGITLNRGGRTFRYLWSEIESTKLREWIRGGGPVVPHLRKVVGLDTRDGVFRFDVSARWPDFPRSKELLASLQEHLDVQTIRYKQWWNPDTWLSYLLLAVLSLFILLWTAFSIVGP